MRSKQSSNGYTTIESGLLALRADPLGCCADLVEREEVNRVDSKLLGVNTDWRDEFHRVVIRHGEQLGDGLAVLGEKSIDAPIPNLAPNVISLVRSTTPGNPRCTGTVSPAARSARSQFTVFLGSKHICVLTKLRKPADRMISCLACNAAVILAESMSACPSG